MNHGTKCDKNKLWSVYLVESTIGVVERKGGEMGENPENAGLLPTKVVDNLVDNVEEFGENCG